VFVNKVYLSFNILVFNGHWGRGKRKPFSVRLWEL